MTEKEVHAGQSNIRLDLVIAAPVLGRVELMPAALRLAHRSRCTTQATVSAPSHTTASVASARSQPRSSPRASSRLRHDVFAFTSSAPNPNLQPLKTRICKSGYLDLLQRHTWVAFSFPRALKFALAIVRCQLVLRSKAISIRLPPCTQTRKLCDRRSQSLTRADNAVL